MYRAVGALLRLESVANRSAIASFNRAAQDYRKSIYRPSIPRPQKRVQGKKEPPKDLLTSLQEKAKAQEEKREKKAKKVKTKEKDDVVKEEEMLEDSKEKSGKKQELQNKSKAERKETEDVGKHNTNKLKPSEDTEKRNQIMSDLYKNMSLSWLKNYMPKYFFTNKTEKSSKDSDEKSHDSPKFKKGSNKIRKVPKKSP